jgi:ferredoxin-nitrate reductase
VADQHEIRTACPYCGVGCGVVATVESGRLLAVRGDDEHPVNRGRTCRKPVELPAAVHHRGRALVPKRREARGAAATPISWDQATQEIAARLAAIKERHGGQAIAFYISGQLLTEDYYAVNKLAKGFLGTNTVDSNSRLCMSSAVAGYRATFGVDGPPPSYEDFETTDLLFLLGSNAAACHPIIWGRIQDRLAEGAELLVADPRRTATAEHADLHLQVRPGGDLALLMGMLHVIDRDGLVDRPFTDAYVDGAEAYLEEARAWDPARAAEASGVSAEVIEEAAHRFASAGRAMTLWSMGANQSTRGTRINQALHALCLLTGNLGRPGTGPLSLTGQPNAMGGREVGGLSNLLPGYRLLDRPEDREAVEQAWGLRPGGLSTTPGLVASDLFAALESGEVKAVWIVATNPLVSFPDATRLAKALDRAELVIAQDAYDPTETSRFADYVLPAAQWPEKDGTMTNSERRISRVRAALTPPGEARPDWEIFAGVGRALGHDAAFSWPDAAAVHAEFVALTAGRPCDQSGLSHARLDREGSLQWPVPATAAGEPLHPGTTRLYESLTFPTPTGRAQLAPPTVEGAAEPPTPDYPLQLLTGRVASHWHTMSRTGRSQRLRSDDPEPYVEVHPDDLDGVGEDGDLIRVRSARGFVVLRVRADATLRPGTAFAPFHWGELFAPAGQGAVNAVTIDATDPVSRQPELKACAVRLEPLSRRARHSVVRPTRLVVVGGGPAAVATIEAAFEHRPPSDWTTTVICGEPALPYDRIALSRALAPDGPTDLELRPASWYHERGVRLALGQPAAVVDTAQRRVVLESGELIGYDKLVLATGSRVATPPILGLDLQNVVRLRTAQDARAIIERATPGATVCVVGGGLVGIEAAAALAERGARVSIVHATPRLMERQLDDGSARWLRRLVEQRGIEIHLDGRCEELIPYEGRVVGVRLADGTVVPADTVIMATGVSPLISVAARAGIATERGILVDDAMRTSAPDVWAVGECAQHDGMVYGTWAPIAEQARVAGADLSGRPAGFRGRPQPTRLKVPGVDLFSCGDPTATIGDPDVDELVAVDSRAGTYRRLVFRGRDLIGAVLMGDTTLGGQLAELLSEGGAVPDDLLDGLLAGTPVDPALELVCSCKSVTAGTIREAITSGAGDLEAVRGCTGASTGCGSCAGRIGQLLREGVPEVAPSP